MTTEEIPLPDVLQSEDYTCGASALQSVLAYFGEQVPEFDLVEELGTSETGGTSPQAIARVARAHGLKAETRTGMTVEQLVEYVVRGIPVLVAIQAWSKEPVSDYSEVWDQGHYVVIVGSDGQKLVFEDPSLLGSRGVLPVEDFQERWHDVSGDRLYHRLGIPFIGTPSPPPQRKHID